MAGPEFMRCSSGIGLALTGSETLDPVLHHLESFRGQNRLRMKLNPLEGETRVTERHDLAFASARRDAEFGGDGAGIHEQGMVSRGGERRGQAAEDSDAFVFDG